MTPALSLRTDPTVLKARDTAALVKMTSLGEGRWKVLVWTLLCFKESLSLVEIAAEDDPAGMRHYYINVGETLEPVQYNTSYIQELAKRFGLALNRDRVDDYVRLYLAFSRGQAGRVIPVEQIDQLPLREELTLITRRKLQSAITPLVATDASHVSGCYLIGDKLFSATAIVSEDGAVTLEPQGLIADTLPILDTVFEG